MARLRLRPSSFCALFIFSAYLPGTTPSNDASSSSDELELSDYFCYTTGGGKCREADVRLLSRDRRYVGDVIPRLADDYNAGSGKGYEKVYMSGHRVPTKMEMLGNLPVPVPPLPADVMSPPPLTASTAGQTTTTMQTTPRTEPTPALVSKKPIAVKKPIDRLEASKTQADPVNYQSVETAENSSVSASGNTSDEYTDISTDNFSKDISNNTLLKNNITQKEEDHHSYYNSTFIVDNNIGSKFWVDMDSEKDVVVSEVLSKSYRKAFVVKLSFDFPFYGHTIRNMTIATGGFLYTGDYIHSWLAATQYIAPLMANFDTSMSQASHIKYRDNGTAFTVEWDHVLLQDRADAGEFSFQATLHSSGDIVFVYKDIPILVERIEDTQHPVKVGISDAYIIDRTIIFVRRKTIYEYHRVNFRREDIKNWTVIYISALPTCHDMTTCHACITAKINFKCKWCAAVQRCSDGVDRKRQEWQQNKCNTSGVGDPSLCDAASLPQQTPRPKDTPHVAKSTGPNSSLVTPTPLQVDAEGGRQYRHTTGMLGLVFVVALMSGLAMWVLYAYRNPHTPSGQVLIRYRPSQWTLRRGEARYTAATIHM